MRYETCYGPSYGHRNFLKSGEAILLLCSATAAYGALHSPAERTQHNRTRPYVNAGNTVDKVRRRGCGAARRAGRWAQRRSGAAGAYIRILLSGTTRSPAGPCALQRDQPHFAMPCRGYGSVGASCRTIGRGGKGIGWAERSDIITTCGRRLMGLKAPICMFLSHAGLYPL